MFFPLTVSLCGSVPLYNMSYYTPLSLFNTFLIHLHTHAHSRTFFTFLGCFFLDFFSRSEMSATGREVISFLFLFAFVQVSAIMCEVVVGSELIYLYVCNSLLKNLFHYLMCVFASINTLFAIAFVKLLTL